MATPIPTNQCEFTLAEVVEATGGTLVRATSTSPRLPWLRGVSIDTRSIEAGSIFVALRGATSDGHDYLAQAAARGAAARSSRLAAIIPRSIASRLPIPSTHWDVLRAAISRGLARRARFR